MTTMILWFYLIVPTKKCLADYDKKQKMAKETDLYIFSSHVPHVMSFNATSPDDQEPEVKVENHDGCYDIFVSTLRVSATPWRPHD